MALTSEQCCNSVYAWILCGWTTIRDHPPNKYHCWNIRLGLDIKILDKNKWSRCSSICSMFNVDPSQTSDFLTGNCLLNNGVMNIPTVSLDWYLTIFFMHSLYCSWMLLISSLTAINPFFSSSLERFCDTIVLLLFIFY